MILKISFDSYFGGAYLLHGGKTLPYRALTEQIRLESLKQCNMTQNWHCGFVPSLLSLSVTQRSFR